MKEKDQDLLTDIENALRMDLQRGLYRNYTDLFMELTSDIYDDYNIENAYELLDSELEDGVYEFPLIIWHPESKRMKDACAIDITLGEIDGGLDFFHEEVTPNESDIDGLMLSVIESERLLSIERSSRIASSISVYVTTSLKDIRNAIKTLLDNEDIDKEKYDDLKDDIKYGSEEKEDLYYVLFYMQHRKDESELEEDEDKDSLYYTTFIDVIPF
ncbi:MAG: hypothetical protein LUD22_01985 [Coprobacillus sp.]|nr:hypothetical protein [Coprobacillus sp.]